MNNHDEILKYLDGELNDDQRLNFEDRLKSDSELKKQLNLYKLMFRAIEIESESHLSNTIYSEFDKYKKRKKLSRIVIITLPIAAAFALLIISYFTFFNQTKTPQELYAEYYRPYQINNETRGLFEVNDSFEDVVSQYKKGDYDDALNSMNLIPKDSTDQRIIDFLYGQISLINGNCENAIVSFNNCLSGPKCTLYEHVRWYLALSYLKCEKYDDSRREFEKVSSQSAYYKEKAEEFLESLPSE
ncbi:MAG: hypothetical protein ABIJ97_00100 [Bacteroidota bacterium]